MTEEITQPLPSAYTEILELTKSSGFTMASDPLTCSLLRTLASSKRSASCLELGTGTGLSTAWILDGLDDQSTLISIDNDSAFLQIAAEKLGNDRRLSLVHIDGAEWVSANRGKKFDFIFADTWHGKYIMLDEVLEMLNPGALYIIDDMLPQPNWPEGHDLKAQNLLSVLDSRDDLSLTRLCWATGLVIAVKK